MFVNNIQPCPKRCLLMLIARVGPRTDGSTRYSLNQSQSQTTTVNWTNDIMMDVLGNCDVHNLSDNC